MTLKVTIVGCGRIADSHVEEIQKIENVRVVGVCDLELLMAEQLAVRYRIPSYYDNLDHMLDKERPDVVHITTPPQSHFSLATRAIDAGCHVYLEKPFTLDYAEAKQLISHTEKARKKITVGHAYHFDPTAIAMRELIHRGVLGEAVHLESFYGYDISGQFGTAVLGSNSHWLHGLPGKLFQNNLDHALHKVIEFIPDDKPTIRALGYRRRTTMHGDNRDNMLDELRAMIRGEAASAYVTFSSHTRPVGHFVRVYGTKNTIHVDYVTRTVTLDQGAKLPSSIGRLLPAFSQGWQYFREGGKNVIRFAKSEFHFFAGMNRLMTLFYDSIIGDSEPPIRYQVILRTAAMMDEILRQVPQVQKEND